jgi:hypothetical protein
MRIVRLLLATLFACGLVVTVGSGPALACSCVSGQTADFVSSADAVVTGRLVDVREPGGFVISSGDPVTYVVDVDAVYRGEAGRRVVFTSSRDGASCGLEGMVVDRRYVFFLGGEAGAREASLCGGTAPASAALEAEVEALTRPAAPPTGEDDPMPAADLTSWLLGATAGGLGLVGVIVARVLRSGRWAT